MKSRMSLREAEPRIYVAMNASEEQVEAFDLEPRLREMIKIRTSQLNGCGYCIDYHTKDARKLGETEQRLYALSAWWETPFFTEEEQAALKLAEQVTLISQQGVTDDVFEKAVRLLGKKKVAQVIFTAMHTGSWNRIAISTHMVAEAD